MWLLVLQYPQPAIGGDADELHKAASVAAAATLGALVKKPGAATAASAQPSAAPAPASGMSCPSLKRQRTSDSQSEKEPKRSRPAMPMAGAEEGAGVAVCVPVAAVAASGGGDSRESPWTKEWSKRMGRHYWFNGATGRSVWEDPADPAAMPVSSA